MKIGVDLRELTQEASAQYLSSNVSLFRGVKGDNGADGLTTVLTDVVNNPDGTLTLTFDNGYVHTTQPMKGDTGQEGDRGNGITDLQLLSDTGYGGSKSWALYYDDDTHDVLTLLNGDTVSEVVAIDVSDTPYHENVYELRMATGSAFRFSVFNGGVNLDMTEVKTLYEANPDTNAFTDADKAQLDSTETSAELDGRDIENRKRSNHTGTQTLDTITETATKKIMTDAERSKLANVPTDTNAALAAVNAKLFSDDSSLDTMYEVVQYIKTDRAKLDTIEVGATADQTAAEIKALYESATGKVLNAVDSIGLTNGGTISWNVDEHTIDVANTYATVQVGQEIGTLVRNNTASTIGDGTVVMETGAIGASGRLTAAPYDGVADGSKILGVMTKATPAGADGYATFFGKIRGLNTSMWAQGDELWVSGSGLTNVKPTSGLVMSVGFVVNSHATVGTIFVRRQAHVMIREV